MMKCPWNEFCEKNKQYAPLFLRLVVGIAFAVHGWQKFSGGVGNVAGFFGNLGIPLPLFMAWVVVIVELVGGIALVLGLGVRYFGALQAIVMLVAIFKVHLKNGLTGPGGFELPLLFLAATLSLTLSGAGPLSLDNLCHKKKELLSQEAAKASAEATSAKPKRSKR